MLRDQLSTEMKSAMRAKESRKLSTIRLILAAVKERDIETRAEERDETADDAMITEILAKMVKQRADSIKAYEEAGRCELAAQEAAEVEIIKSFLPRQLDESEVEDVAKKAIDALEASGLKDIGRVMAQLKENYAGQMDMGFASRTVKALLS